MQRLQDERNDARQELSQTRTELTHAVAEIHLLSRQVMEASVRVLEQTIHGSESRATKAQAEYLATVAEGMEKKLEIHHAQLMQEVDSSELRVALQQRASEMREEIKSVKLQIKNTEEELLDVRSLKGDETLVGEYSKLLIETEKVKREIAVLQRSK